MLAPSGRTDLTKPPNGRFRWLIVALMFVVSAVSYLDRNNLSIAAAPIKKSFDLTDVELGIVFSAFALGYALSQPLAGWLADRFGAYRTVAIALLWWCFFTTLTPIVPPSAQHALFWLIAVRCMLGIGESIIYPACNRLVSSWIPKSERGVANGWIFAGVGVGGGIAPPLVTWIVLRLGWQWAFYVSALIGMVIVCIWLALVRNQPMAHPAVTADELAYIQAGLPPASKVPQARLGWKAVLTDRQVSLLTFSYFCFGYVAYIFFSWFFIYLSTVRGLDLKASAVLATLPFLAMTVFSPLGGMISDRVARAGRERIARCGIAAVSMIVAGLFVAAATRVVDARVASLILAGGAGSLYIAQSAYWTLSANIGGPSAGVVSGVMNMGAQLGGVVTASMTPVVAKMFGWDASFLVAACVGIAGGLAWLFVDPDHRLSMPNAG